MTKILRKSSLSRAGAIRLRPTWRLTYEASSLANVLSVPRMLDEMVKSTNSLRSTSIVKKKKIPHPAPIQPIDAHQMQTPSSIPLQMEGGGKMRGSVQLCDIYARIPTERKSTFNTCTVFSNGYKWSILTLYALQWIQEAVAGLQMWERLGRNCGCRHIVAAISPLSASSSPA